MQYEQWSMEQQSRKCEENQIDKLKMLYDIACIPILAVTQSFQKWDSYR